MNYFYMNVWLKKQKRFNEAQVTRNYIREVENRMD